MNEGARIVEEGIALRAGDIDVVYINGYGFPAWRGGPMYWAQTQRAWTRVVQHHGAARADARQALGPGAAAEARWPRAAGLGALMRAPVALGSAAALRRCSSRAQRRPTVPPRRARARPCMSRTYRRRVSEWARGAQLYAGLGDFHRAVSTRSPQAQAYFDQGMRLLWAFNHDEATRSFAQAARLDPDCAACYWGVALTVGPNYNLTSVDEVRVRVAFEALQQARAHAAARLGGRAGADRGAGCALPESAGARRQAPGRRCSPPTRRRWRASRQRFPDDDDVQVMTAEAR